MGRKRADGSGICKVGLLVLTLHCRAGAAADVQLDSCGNTRNFTSCKTDPSSQSLCMELGDGFVCVKGAGINASYGCHCYGFIGYECANSPDEPLRCEQSATCSGVISAVWLVAGVAAVRVGYIASNVLYQLQRALPGKKCINLKVPANTSLTLLVVGSMAWLAEAACVLSGTIGSDHGYAEIYYMPYFSGILTVSVTVAVLNVAGAWVQVVKNSVDLKKTSDSKLTNIVLAVQTVGVFFAIANVVLFLLAEFDANSVMSVLLALIIIVSYSYGARKLGKMIMTAASVAASNHSGSRASTQLKRSVQGIIRCANGVAFGFFLQICGLLIYLSNPELGSDEEEFHLESSCRPIRSIGGSLIFTGPVVSAYSVAVFLRATSCRGLKAKKSKTAKVANVKSVTTSSVTDCSGDDSLSNFGAKSVGVGNSSTKDLTTSTHTSRHAMEPTTSEVSADSTQTSTSDGYSTET